VDERGKVEQRYAELEWRYLVDELVPPFWGGYRVVPDSVEFRQGRENRLHDRLRYRREDAGADWFTPLELARCRPSAIRPGWRLGPG